MLTKLALCLLLAAACTALEILWGKYQDEKAAKRDAVAHNVNMEKDLQDAAAARDNAEYWRNIAEKVAAAYIDRSNRLQRKLQETTCPTNNHVWNEYGFCRKCWARNTDFRPWIRSIPENGEIRNGGTSRTPSPTTGDAVRTDKEGAL